MNAWTLCLDFGTAYSKAAAAPLGAWSQFRPGLVRPLSLAAHEPGANPFLLESAVFVDNDRVYFGHAAVLRASEQAHAKRAALRSFKTLLSVSDLDRVLNTNAPTTIDPHRLFQMRDLVVLYLAYLLAAAEGAVSRDAELRAADSIQRRYAAPAWRGGDAAGAHDMVVRLFGEAEAFRAAIGSKALLNPLGVTLKAIGDMLPPAQTAPHPIAMGLVFEATAAAVYTSVGLEGDSSHLVVVDMGAGTTDIAALVREGVHMSELPAARVTLKQAGDFLDQVIANLVLKASPWARTEEQQSMLWRALMQHMRDVKENLFADGQAALRHEGRVITLRAQDLTRDRDYGDFVANLEEAYATAMAAVAAEARARGASEAQVVAVGGGASAPPVQYLLETPPKSAGKMRINVRPAVPDWAHDRQFEGNLAPVFSQLAIAIGGALAPEEMLAAGPN